MRFEAFVMSLSHPTKQGYHCELALLATKHNRNLFQLSGYSFCVMRVLA